MLRKLNCFLNIVIGSFIGIFIGYGIYKFWHFKTYPNLYAMQSAPWYTELLLDGAMVVVVVEMCIRDRTYTYQGKIAGSFVSAGTYLVIPEGVYRSMNPRGTAYG